MPSPEEPFEQLQDLFHHPDLLMIHIIEHQDGGKTNVVGSYHNSDQYDSSFSIEWTQQSGSTRTTIFRSTSWRCEVKGYVAFLIRTDKDPKGTSDVPWKTANLYTIVFGPRDRF